MNTTTSTLADLPNNKTGIVVAFNGGAEFQQRITSLGVFIGCEVKTLDNKARNGILIGVGESRIAIGHGMAEKIILA